VKRSGLERARTRQSGPSFGVANWKGVDTAETLLLEREQDLRRIMTALASARSGTGGVVALEGSAGIGKTRLLRRAIELAGERDVATISARGGQMETAFAFGVARQLFEPVLAAAEERERKALLDGAAAAAAWLVGGGQAGRRAEAGRGGDRGYATLHGLYWLTANLSARAPLLMAVDDVHWADVPSLRFLVYLVRRVHHLPVLLLIAVRPEDPRARSLLLTELVAGPGVEVVRPEPLTLGAVGTLLGDAFPAEPLDPQLVHACWTATGGNPFLVTQLVRALGASGVQPNSTAVEQIGEVGMATVSGWINVRLAALPASATALAEAVAVLGEGSDSAQAARLAGLDATCCDEAVDGLVSVGILRGVEGLSFVHPLVRSAIYAGLPPRRRARAHREAARLLWESQAAAERAASHLLAVPPAEDGKIAEILLAAAHSASHNGAPDTAVRYLRRALSEPPPETARPELLRELGAAEQSAGHFAKAADDLRLALACTDDIEAKIEIGFRLRYALVWSNRAQEVAPALDGIIAEAAERDPDGALLLEAATAGIPLVDLSTPMSRRARLRRVVEPAFRGEPVPSHISSLAAVEALYANRPAADVLALAEQAARGWHLLPGFARAPLTAQLFVALVFGEHFTLARRLLDEEMDDARRHGSAAQFLNAASFRSMLFYRLGALADAETDARAALEAAHLLRAGTGPSGNGASARSLHAPMVVAVLVDALIERGELEEAAQLLRQTGLADADSPLLLFTFLISARARLRAAEGRTRQAIAELVALGNRMARVRSPALVPWRSQAALALAGDDPEEARRLAGKELKLARVFGAPRALGIALRAAAQSGPRSERVPLLGEAVGVLEDSPARLEHARALVDLGGALRRQGQRSEARDKLERGMDIAQRCEATALAELAREELRACGARPRRLALTGVDALTGAERRVADLAAQGLSNRQIAQALAVSVATVETHLRHVFHKLDIGSRQELAEQLGGPNEPARG
jgi:DNA-binding CsgD family transcriptional regulator